VTRLVKKAKGYRATGQAKKKVDVQVIMLPRREGHPPTLRDGGKHHRINSALFSERSFTGGHDPSMAVEDSLLADSSRGE